MTISLIHPSRGRAKKSFENVNEWIAKAGSKVEIVLSVDINDNSDYDTEYQKFGPLCGGSCTRKFGYFIGIKNNNKSVVEATNNAVKSATGDIIVYLSDDFKCPDNWGLSLIKELEGENRPLLLKVDDCLQGFDVPVLTIPIMNRALYERLGYFFHPEYKSMWVDCDLFETVKRMGAIKNAEHLKFPHEHHSIGKCVKDETYRASESNWAQGLEVFNRRKKQHFPV